MSDPLGSYMEIGEVNEGGASGIRVGLLTYNDPSETYSTYLGSNFDESYQKRFGKFPSQGPGNTSGPNPYQSCLAIKGGVVERGQEEEVVLNTPQLGIPCPEPKAPLRPMLPGADLRDNTPAYNNDYTVQMLDVLDIPSFINPWVLPSMTTQVPQGLIQPVLQLRGARPKDVVLQKLNGGVPMTQSEVSGMAEPLKQGKTDAPSIITLVGPSVSQVGEPSVTELRPNVYERHNWRYTKRFKQVGPAENLMPTTQKVSICSTPEVITEQGTQRDSVPMELITQ